ncbi:hypothetical protein E4U43_003922 [Claviceps pusilla]|uniref:SnoaL-like domain-containing protein n=1 Tax=Claviceps pusilla TaxID=123648 RepID=A0A9P7NFP9_9HYPO|nr:hypothetical protein E4U43_003922 [Claviceps pusilla]
MSTHAVQKATLDKFIDAWARWHPDDFIGLWSDDFVFTTLPFSAGKPSRGRDKVEPRFRMLMRTLTNYRALPRAENKVLALIIPQLNVKYIVHDPHNRKACIYAVVRADAPCGAYVNEQALFLAFDESGEKVVRIEEMNDSAFRKEWDLKYYALHGIGVPPRGEASG